MHPTVYTGFFLKMQQKILMRKWQSPLLAEAQPVLFKTPPIREHCFFISKIAMELTMATLISQPLFCESGPSWLIYQNYGYPEKETE